MPIQSRSALIWTDISIIFWKGSFFNVWIESTNCIVYQIIHRSTFIQNTAINGSNGVIFCNSSLKIKKCKIENNKPNDDIEPDGIIARNFKHLDELIHSGEKEIVLDSDIFFDEEYRFTYMDGIKLDVDNIIIDGNSFTIDARGNSRIFNCTGKNITIKNITLKNGFSQDSGGTIINAGELTIKKSSLTNSQSKKDGGSIQNLGKLNIEESILSDNTACENGGALVNTGELAIDESTIIKNTACDNGGAIFNAGELIMSNSKLSNNSAKNRSGGAIRNLGEITIIKSIFSQNIANDDGGAIKSNENTLKLEKCNFKGNKPNDY